MRLRTVALALALCFGVTGLVQASPAKQKNVKVKPQKAKKFKPSKKYKQSKTFKASKTSKAAQVKPRKAKKVKSAHRG